MEVALQIASDFIEAQGMVAFVVVILAVLMYRDQTNRAVESKQQGETLSILRMEVSNNTATLQKMDDLKSGVVNKVDELKTDLLAEARLISETSSEDRAGVRKALEQTTATMEKQSESVITMSEILKEVNQAIADVKNMLSEGGVTLSEDALNKVADIVMSRINPEFIELKDCIKSTQETPVIPTDKPKMSVPIESKEETK